MFGAPFKIQYTADHWQQRIYKVGEDGSYIVIETNPEAPDFIYGIQITGSKSTKNARIQ
jgi:hypothetical protein